MTLGPSSGDAVEAGWQKVCVDGRVRPELLEAAYAEARLRQLFPWTGMGELHFSRCTEQGWTWDIPYIQPAAGGSYWVSGPLRSQAVGPAETVSQAIVTWVRLQDGRRMVSGVSYDLSSAEGRKAELAAEGASETEIVKVKPGQ
ncbi:DUF6193 family natural product biosynthesis protein [Streptomyces sp. NPDC020817]|uniref:DUF6193 family natural product biosynthesis protein n=1 Tax=Streptomyces sp. NPDC020817 TaxID=3365095 RepID=UPI0037A5B247